MARTSDEADRRRLPLISETQRANADRCAGYRHNKAPCIDYLVEDRLDLTGAWWA